LEICIYKTLLLHRPDNFIDFTLNCPPHFATKFCGWSQVLCSVYLLAKDFRKTLHLLPWDLRFEPGGAKLASCPGTRGGLRLCGAPGWNLERGPTVAYAENFHGGSFSGIWWFVVCGVRSLWRHNSTSYSCFQTNVLAKFV